MTRIYIEDTIVSPATALGQAGVGIVRVSGKKCLEIGLALCQKKGLVNRCAHFAKFFDLHNELIDFGIVIYFQSPASFTGEDVLEIHCHGSPVIIDLIVQRCLQLGARAARAGEFTERAFFNEKIDLAQAESIADLIASQTKQAAKSAMNSLQGVFSDEIKKISAKIIYLRTYTEAAIDFSDEEIDFLKESILEKTLKEIIEDVYLLLKKSEQGLLLREGISIVLAGKPNAGKSSLMNALSEKNRSIVTAVAGTTRDIISEQIQIEGVPVMLYDTAGLRESVDIVEKEGVIRALDVIKKAHLILWIYDFSDMENIQENKFLKDEIGIDIENSQKVIFVRNKIDQIKNECDEDKKIKNQKIVSISAKEKIGLDHLKKKILEEIGYFSASDGIFSARRRHIDALNQTKHFLDLAHQRLGFSLGELMAEDLKMAHRFLGEIVGEFTSEDLLDSIFSSFCIGK